MWQSDRQREPLIGRKLTNRKSHIGFRFGAEEPEGKAEVDGQLEIDIEELGRMTRASRWL